MRFVKRPSTSIEAPVARSLVLLLSASRTFSYLDLERIARFAAREDAAVTQWKGNRFRVTIDGVEISILYRAAPYVRRPGRLANCLQDVTLARAVGLHKACLFLDLESEPQGAAHAWAALKRLSDALIDADTVATYDVDAGRFQLTSPLAPLAEGAIEGEMLSPAFA